MDMNALLMNFLRYDCLLVDYHLHIFLLSFFFPLICNLFLFIYFSFLFVGFETGTSDNFYPSHLPPELGFKGHFFLVSRDGVCLGVWVGII